MKSWIIKHTLLIWLMAGGVALAAGTTYHSLKSTDSPTFAGLTLTADETIQGGDLTVGVSGSEPGDIVLHDAGTITMHDDGNDTNVVIGPVTNGTTTLGVTGSIDASGDVAAGTLTAGSGSITDSSGAISFGDENLSTTGTLAGATAKFSSLTDTYIPYHVADATGLADSPLIRSGTSTVTLSAAQDAAATFNLYADAGDDAADKIALSMSAAGVFSIQPSADSVTGVQILDTDGGTPILNVDTTNELVGIGTAAPNAKLTVGTPAASTVNGASVSGANQAPNGAGTGGNLYVFTTDAMAVDTGGHIGFGGVYTGSTETRWASIAGLKENATAGQYGGYLALYTRAHGAVCGERMRITGAGYVGIGTTGPEARLDVNHATGDCLQLTYNDGDGSAANHVDFAVSATGDLTLAPSGGDAYITGDVGISTANITAGSGTGITVNHTGRVNQHVYKVTTTYAAYADTDTTKGIVIATLPAKTKIISCYADTTTPYTGGAVSAATLRVGVTAEDAAQIIASHDVLSGAVTKGLADADMGTSMTRAAAIQGGYLPSWSGTTAIYATINTTDANTNALTAGSTTFYLVTERY